MDFYLRCNSLKCRAQLKERAVVTTCSHIFCLQCASNLGLSHQTSVDRRCPACQTILVNPDDAVATILNPSEDYKTSVLSGLDPNTIMECAGRALLFWTYQTTQEIFYQEFLGKALTEKYANLNSQMDKVIHNANSEISALQARISDMQTTQDQLRKKNQELVDLYGEKCTRFTQITNLYNLLKSRAMKSQMQTAATDSVHQTLNSLAPSHQNNVPPPSSFAATASGAAAGAAAAGAAGLPMHMHTHTALGSSVPPQTPLHRYPVDREGVEQLHRHQRSGTGSSKGAATQKQKQKQTVDAVAMPPPPRQGRLLGDPRHRTIQHRARLVGGSGSGGGGGAGGGSSTRPTTGSSTLPHDSVLLARFGADSGPNNPFLVGAESISRGDGGHRRHADYPGEPPGVRSYFDSTGL
ncbi:cyclin [Aspergillus uvarum CBS 121591]|uniref:Cyclin n=1 Tax=Aspergillus uvarum CBS 121591 TaxID=1448315 RepID=A0A319CD92_9EURO|nr:cyclin [Aspergillus uvarum CBS 121591]PYH83625.1 cyclin [Aspergillus uvarum CBS 121591]